MESYIPQTVQAYELDRELSYLTDSQELEELLYNIGLKPEWRKDITAAFVSVKDGDYQEVWLSEAPNHYSVNALYHNRAYYGLKI
jgi:hypothetical protein